MSEATEKKGKQLTQAQAKYFARKISSEQADDIFEEFLSLTKADQRFYCTRKAEELGVSRDTIERIVYNEKRIKRRLAHREKVRDLEMIKAYGALGDAVDLQIGFIRNAANLPPNMRGLAQNAATDLMNRLNFKEKVAEEDRTMHVIFGSDIPLGMPKAVGEEREALPAGGEPDEADDCEVV